MTRKTLATVLSSAFFGTVVGGILGAPTEASAWWQRRLAAACVPVGTPTSTAVFDAMGGGWRNEGSDLLAIHCPIEENSTMTKASPNTLNVYVFDGSSTQSVSARACSKYTGAFGANCGNTVYTSGPGAGTWSTLSPPVTVWDTNPSDLPFLFVVLPSSQYSYLAGWYLSS